MNQKKLAKWLEVIIVCVALAGVFIYSVVVPNMGDAIIYANGEEFRGWYIPWLIFLWITAIPCYTMLFYFWRICMRIEKGNPFCAANAVGFKRISQWSLVNGVYFFIGNIVLYLADMSHPGVALVSIFVVFVFIAIAVAAAVLSHLVFKAADLESESELTI